MSAAGCGAAMHAEVWRVAAWQYEGYSLDGRSAGSTPAPGAFARRGQVRLGRACRRESGRGEFRRGMGFISATGRHQGSSPWRARVRPGFIGLDRVWQCTASQRSASQGIYRQKGIHRGSSPWRARPGQVWRRVFWRGVVGRGITRGYRQNGIHRGSSPRLARGWARRAVARRVLATRDMGLVAGSGCRGVRFTSPARAARRGMFARGTAGSGTARFGSVGQGVDGRGWQALGFKSRARTGPARLGDAR